VQERKIHDVARDRLRCGRGDRPRAKVGTPALHPSLGMSSASVRSIDSANLNDDLRAELVVLASSSGPHGLVRDSIDDARGLGRRQRPSQHRQPPAALAARTVSHGPWSTPRDPDSASVAGGVPDAELSPLGPNSIFKLTVASDWARQQHGRAPRSHVSLSGGATAVANLISPSVLAIPQIQLLPLPRRVAGDKLVTRYVDGLETEYRLFDLQSRLTAAGLERLQRQTEDVRSAGGAGAVAGAVASDDASDGSAIPAVFFSPSFQLDDPRTFKQIIGTTAIVSDEHAGADYLASNTQLQEQLLHYLDLVEIELVEEIARLLGSFFGTIDDIQRIGARSQDCVTQLDLLSAELAALEQSQSQRGVHILDLVAKRHYVQQLEDGVLQVQRVVAQFERCQHLFAQAQYSECLAAIVDAERAAAGVATLPALFDLQNDLHKLKTTCTAEYTRAFVDELVRDLQRHYRGVGAAEALQRMSTNGGGSYQRVDAATTELLRQRVRQLADSGALSAAYRSYQDRVVDEVKDIIKTNLPRRVADTDSDASRPGLVPPRDEASSSLSTSLRAMSRQEFLDMLVTTFTSLVECLRRLTTHQKLLLDLALTLLSADTTDVMTLDITVAISRAIEITQVRLCKVINVRLELIADLPVEDYLRVYALIQAYLRECELINPGFISTDSGKTLSDWARNHVGYFVHRLHLNALKALIYECDREVWKEVSDMATLRTVQRIVNELVTYAEYVESEGRSGYLGDQWLQLMDVSRAADPHTTATRAADLLEVEGSRIRVGLQQFLVPQLLVGVVAALRDYAVLSKAFGGRAATIGNDVLNYCKLLNSRTSQAILGAGATRTAGLKHIFPKHIALCIQLVGFMIALLERVSGIFGTPSDGDELTFSRLISNYKDHENELFGKLISMMYERTVNHCNTIKTIDWSVPIAPPHQCHPYMETLVKDTTTITKVLVKYLPPHQCHLILLQVFDNYKKLFVECYCTQIPQFKDFKEKHSLLKDIDFFRVKLGEVPGYGNSGQIIWENINSMPTIEDARMEEIMRKNIERERAIEPARKSTDIIRRSLETVRGKRTEAQLSSTEVAEVTPAEQANQVNSERDGETERATPLSSEENLATESVAAEMKTLPAPEHPNGLASNEAMDEVLAPPELPEDAATSLATSDGDEPVAAELGPDSVPAEGTVSTAEDASGGSEDVAPIASDAREPEAFHEEPTRSEAPSGAAAATNPEVNTKPEVVEAKAADEAATALDTTPKPIEELKPATAEADIDSEPHKVLTDTTSPDKPAPGKPGKKKNKRKKKGKH
jgi:vacuolar protein sorting-associated protein 54